MQVYTLINTHQQILFFHIFSQICRRVQNIGIMYAMQGGFNLMHPSVNLNFGSNPPPPGPNMA
jgi:hypothetical protein